MMGSSLNAGLRMEEQDTAPLPWTILSESPHGTRHPVRE